MAGLELFFFYLFAVAAPLSIAALNVAQGGLTLFFLGRVVTGKWRPGLPAILLMAWLVWCALCALASPLRAEALGGVLNFWSWSAFLVGTALSAETKEHWASWTRFLAVSVLLTLPASLAEFFLGTDIFHHQALYQIVPIGTVNAYGYFSHHLTYAGSMTIAACVLAAVLLYGEAGRKALQWAGAPSALAGVAMSLARTYVLGLIAALPVLLWPRGTKRVVRSCALALVFVAALGFFGPAVIRARFHSLWDMNNPSNAERIYLWKAALAQWGERPLLGWGPGTYEKTAEPFKAPYAERIHYPNMPPGFKTKGHCHNLYLMVALQTGAVGLLLFLAFIAAAIRGLWRQTNAAIKWGALAALAAFLVGGLFEYNGGDVEVATLMFFLLGLAQGEGGRRQA